MSKLIDITITPIGSSNDVVSLSDAKAYMRVDFDDDSIIASLISASRQRLERYASRVFLQSNCKAVYTQEGYGDRVLLSYCDNITMNAGSSYEVMPGNYIDTTDKVVLLEYTAGYTVIPEWIKHAVLLDVAYMYENRGDIAATVISSEVKDYLMPYVMWSYL